MLETPTLLFILTTPTTAVYTLFGLSESIVEDYLLRMTEDYSDNSSVLYAPIQMCYMLTILPYLIINKM